MYDTPQDQSLMIKQLVKDNQNLKLKARRRRRRRCALALALACLGLALAALTLTLRGPRCISLPQLYFLEEKFARHVTRLADPGAVEKMMQEARAWRCAALHLHAHQLTQRAL
jgi:hypothetical protein